MHPHIKELLSRSLGAIFCLFGITLLGVMAWAIYDTGQWSYLGAGLLSLTMIGAGWPRLFPAVYAPIPIDHNDPIMRTAIDRSRRELNRLKQGLADNRKQPFVKFPLRSPSGETEHIWGIVHSLQGRELTVSLANDPVEDHGELDPRQTVRLSDVEDWILVSSSGQTEGGYSMGAMAAIYKREHGWIPAALRKEIRGFRDLSVENL